MKYGIAVVMVAFFASYYLPSIQATIGQVSADLHQVNESFDRVASLGR